MTSLNPRVFVEKADCVHVRQSIQNIIERSGGLDLEHGSTIAIKLNLSCSRSYETGITSDPRVIESLIDYLNLSYEPRTIFLVESDSTAEKADYLFKWLGFSKLAREKKAELVNLSRDKTCRKRIDGLAFREVDFPDTLDKVDFFMTVAKLKSHSQAGISCALKNQFGCLPHWRKLDYHRFLDGAIVDANLLRRPDFSIVDGIVVPEGLLGPSAGLPTRANLLIGGKDPVAVDSVCARILRRNPRRIGHLVKAAQRDLGTTKYVMDGDSIRALRDYRFRMHLVDYGVRLLFARILKRRISTTT